MARADRPKTVFPSAREDAGAAVAVESTPQTGSPSYRLAYADTEFLLRDELRAVRLQLELMKPELIQQELGVLSTVVVTGGGPGIMEAANRGADDVGGKSIGLSIVLPHEQHPNPYVTPELSFQFHYFAVRKMHFLLRAKALVVFPGGYGTLDELFETLTLIQTRKVKPVPVLLFGRDYWERVIRFDALVEEGTIGLADLDLFQYVETAEEAWELIRDFYGFARGVGPES